jgi:predicted nucleotidyltransferase
MKKKKLIDNTLLRQLKNMRPQVSHDFGVSRIGVFGSYARGEEKRDSDIDILVEFDRPISLFDFSRLKIFLSEQLGIPVDLVTAGALKPLIRDQILTNVSYL